MKKTKPITSVTSRAAFREHLVEKFVQQNLPPRNPRKSRIKGMGRFAENYRDFEICAAETPVVGNLELFTAPEWWGGIRCINVPVVSRFIVFCTREERRSYKVAWSASLS